MATIERRREAVVHAARSLAPQVDRLVVVLTDYSDPPVELVTIPNVETVAVSRGNDTLGDAGKFRPFFHRADPPSGYHLTADDDLVYPGDYVERTIAAIERYERRAVISWHGRSFTRFPVRSYYRGSRVCFRCLDLVRRDHPVHCPGTGVMGWHSDTVRREPFGPDDFRAPNMADVWVGAKLQRVGIPAVCAAHDPGWITQVDTELTAPSLSIHATARTDDRVQTNAVNALCAWTLHGGPRLRVICPTLNRPEMLRASVGRLIEASAGLCNLDVHVYDDGSEPPAKLDGVTVHRIDPPEAPHGKQRFRDLCDRMFFECRPDAGVGEPWDMVLWTVDDVLLERGGLVELVRAWELLRAQDPKALTLNPLVDIGRRDKPCWTKYRPKLFEFEDGRGARRTYRRTQWVDCCAIFDRRFLEVFGYGCPGPPRNWFESRPSISSGVGRTLSLRAHNAGWRMYQTVETLFRHGRHDSRMHPYCRNRPTTETGPETGPERTQPPDDVVVAEGLL